MDAFVLSSTVLPCLDRAQFKSCRGLVQYKIVLKVVPEM